MKAGVLVSAAVGIQVIEVTGKMDLPALGAGFIAQAYLPIVEWGFDRRMLIIRWSDGKS